MSVEIAVGHTEEARALVEAGEVKPGDKALDVPVSSMSDRQIAEESLIHLRNLRDGLTTISEGMASSPLMKMLNGGGGGIGALFQRG